MKNGANNGQFKPGHSVKKGKASPGSGRTPDWLKKKCDKILARCKLFEFLGDVISGAPIPQPDFESGSAVLLPASPKDRLKAAEMLLDRRFGKPDQAHEISGKDGGPVVIEVVRYA